MGHGMNQDNQELTTLAPPFIITTATSSYVPLDPTFVLQHYRRAKQPQSRRLVRRVMAVSSFLLLPRFLGYGHQSACGSVLKQMCSKGLGGNREAKTIY